MVIHTCMYGCIYMYLHTLLLEHLFFINIQRDDNNNDKHRQGSKRKVFEYFLVGII